MVKSKLGWCILLQFCWFGSAALPRLSLSSGAESSIPANVSSPSSSSTFTASGLTTSNGTNRVLLNAMPHRFRIPDTEPPFTLHISLPHDQDAPGESLATVIIHAMDFTLKQLANGEGFDFVSRAGIAFNDEIVDLRARSQLPPLQAISYASLGRILRVIWDLCKQSGYRTWKFDIFVEQGPREILVGSVALHNDL